MASPGLHHEGSAPDCNRDTMASKSPFFDATKRLSSRDTATALKDQCTIIELLICMACSTFTAAMCK